MLIIEELFKFVFILCFAKFSSGVQSIRRASSSTFTIDNGQISLFWIDDNIRECSNDCRLTQSLLRQLVPNAKFEWDIDDAFYNINRVKDTAKIILIVVSGRKASHLFQYLTYYDLDEHISALFIFCNNIDDYQHLQHDKLIGIFTDPQVLAESLRANKFMLFTKKSTFSINLFDQEQTWSRQMPLVALTHMWHQLLLEVLAALPRDEQAKLEMIKKSKEYYVGQYTELKQIELFYSSYTSDTAIEWYTADSFVHKLVNKALRTENIDLLYAFRFFIGDLKAAIEREHINQQKISGTVVSKMKIGSNSLIKLFSGQKLPRRELDKLKLSLGKVISVHSFFSTSLSSSEAIDFAKLGVLPDNMQRVLIEISLNTSTQGMVSFAEIEHRTRFRDEQEVLFDCNALFNITYMEYNWYSEMWLLKMTAISKNSVEKHPYLDMIRETVIQNHSAIIGFGIILAQGFGRKEQALSYFDQILRTEPSTHNDIPNVLQQRAVLYEEHGDHALALRDYERALEIRQERIRENRLAVASIKSNIGMLQSTKSDFQASLASHKEALDIYEELYGTKKDHLTKAKVNENIGLAYYKNGSAIEANAYFMRAWGIYRRILPEKHPLLVQLLGHIGAVHEAVNNSTLAVQFFHRQLNWSQNILPPDHPLLITCLDSVLRVHTKFNQSSNISIVFSEYFDNLKKILGERHPVIPRLLVMTAVLFESTQPTKAIALYEQALHISKDLTQIDRNTMFKCHKNLAELYRKSKNMDEALSHATQALIYQQQLSSETQNHSLEAAELHNIGSIYMEMGLPTNALQYLSKSLSVYRSTYVHDHPNVQAVLASIIQAANQTGSYSQADSDGKSFK